MKKALLFMLSLLVLSSVLVSCGKTEKKEGFSLVKIAIYSQAGPKGTANRKWVAYMKRGESLSLVEVKGFYSKVELADGETVGWLESKWIFIGPKKPITFIEKNKMYSRPDKVSPVKYNVKKGQTGYIVKTGKNGWYKINIKSSWKFAWANESQFSRGIVKIERAPRPIQLSGTVYVDSENGLKMRADAHTGAAEVATLKYGTAVKVIMQNPGEETYSGRKGLWTEIQWGDKKGYVFGGFLHPEKP